MKTTYACGHPHQLIPGSPLTAVSCLVCDAVIRDARKQEAQAQLAADRIEMARLDAERLRRFREHARELRIQRIAAGYVSRLRKAGLDDYRTVPSLSELANDLGPTRMKPTMRGVILAALSDVIERGCYAWFGRWGWGTPDYDGWSGWVRGAIETALRDGPVSEVHA